MNEEQVREIAEEIGDRKIKEHVDSNIQFGAIFGLFFLGIQLGMVCYLYLTR